VRHTDRLAEAPATSATGTATSSWTPVVIGLGAVATRVVAGVNQTWTKPDVQRIGAAGGQ